MIEQFEAVSYKGLQEFSLGPMGRVNLVTGPNGVGKTSLAEALWLFHGRYNPSILWNLHVQRRSHCTGRAHLPGTGRSHCDVCEGSEDGMSYGVTFEYGEVMQTLCMRARHDSAANRSSAVAEESHGYATENTSPDSPEGNPLSQNIPMLGRVRAAYDPDPNAGAYDSEIVLGPYGPALARPAPQPERSTSVIMTRDAPFPISPDTIERFSDMVAAGKKRLLLEVLRVIQPRVQDIQILSHQGTPSLWVEVETGELLPVEAAGGGLVRLLGLAVNFFTARGGLIVIDEIENGIHHSALPELWRQIRHLGSLLDVQSVITTHSLECVRAAVAVEGNGQAPSDFVVHRMYQAKDGARRSETYDGDKLMTTLELGFDIR